MLPTLNSRKTNLIVAILATTLAFSASTSLQAAEKKITVKSTKAAAEEKFKAPLPGEVVVSDQEYNHFIFSDPVSQLVFPGGTVNEPVYLGDYREVLVKPRVGVTKPIQMIAELESGAVHKIYLRVGKVHGVTHTVGSKREHAHAQHQRAVESGEIDASSTPAAGSEDIELLKVAVTGSNPMGFDIAHLPAASRFDKFTAVPMKALSNGIKTIYVFSLVAASGQTAVVAPPQFYKDGITAVLLDGDVVDANHTPLLYVVKESNDE